MPSIFLSHSHSDKQFVRKLATDLRRYGIRVWVDEAEIKLGDSLIEKIREGIDNMDYMAVILSPDSVKSEWVRKEVDVAMNQEIERKRIKVLPLLIQDCDIPGFLKGKLFADFRGGEKYETGLELVLEKLGIAIADIKRAINLELTKNAMRLQSDNDYFNGTMFVNLLSSAFGFKYHVDETYTLPRRSVSYVREVMVEAFKNIYSIRKSPGYIPNTLAMDSACLGKDYLPHFNTLDIPFLTQDLATNVAMFKKEFQSKYNESKREDDPSDYRAKLEFFNDVIRVLTNLTLQYGGYMIGVPLIDHTYEEITWLLQDKDSMHLVDLVSSFGDELDDLVGFWMSSDSVAFIYRTVLGIHDNWLKTDSFSGLAEIVRCCMLYINKVKGLRKKRLEAWIVPNFVYISKNEADRMAQLSGDIERKFRGSGIPISLTVLNARNIMEILNNVHLKWFAQHLEQLQEVVRVDRKGK